ncbi:pirin family protein [Croceimicrobium sp.]|uniref:pirin family protein n=1 Tax=Croceimicrobium sp. TaxID=2828340 RepID=UPI003BAB6964
MSNTDLIIPERSRDIGDFLVGRLLPFRKKRMVGPFIFIDHMGPTELGPDHYMDVDQHPHIGLATLTFLLEGEVEHRDSLGTEQIIRPGSVNWMVAGSGVSHTERTPMHLRKGNSFTVHGYQIWVALPKEVEQIEPSFHHFASDDLPQWQDGPNQWKLVAGEAFGRQSPVPTHSPLFMLELKCETDSSIDLRGQLKGEIGICVVKGKVWACDQEVEAGHLLVSKDENTCKLKVAANSHILFFGGEALPEARTIYWNFVASDPKLIENAKEKWQNHDWPKVDGDNSYVPLPEFS